MENNKCGCEDIKQDKEIKEKLKEDAGCGCGEETIEEPEEDAGCGCGSGNTEASLDSGCGCGPVDIPDLSRVENPHNPKIIADEEFMQKFEDYAHSLGIISIGYTLFTPDLLIKNKFIQYPNTIVLTMEMGEEIIKTAPGDEAKDLNDTAYVRLGILTTKLSDYLRENGYATEIAHPYGGLVAFSPLAQKAGLGYIGNSGLLITPELGPRQKISAIFTSIANLPIKEENKYAWIPEYCDKCGKCVKACPEKALIEKETCCGGTEIELIQKSCIGCSQGCTYCIESCPFEEKGYMHVKNKFEKMNAKLKEKQSKKFKVELWDNWAKENSDLFNSLVAGATIAISMAENKEKLIFLEKGDDSLNVDIKPLSELEDSEADLLFVITEKNIAELLNGSTVRFVDMVSSGRIGIYGLKSESELISKGYMALLDSLGLRFGGGSCCG